jgi:hypothetical protein
MIRTYELENLEFDYNDPWSRYRGRNHNLMIIVKFINIGVI